MITKGIITAVKENKYEVHIPLFDSAGVSKKYITTATLCYQPGNYNSYKVDDIVYIAFERNNISNPVIIGKLYLGKEEEAFNAIFTNSLEVTGKAILPDDTTIGQLHLSDIIDNIKGFDQYKGLSSDLPVIAVCIDPITNLYGYSIEGYTYSLENETGFDYIIKYNNSNPTQVEVQNYMKYMTGRSAIPVLTSIEAFEGAFMFKDGRIYYPKYENDILKLIAVQPNHFTTVAEVKKLIEELTTGVALDDLSDGTWKTEKKVGMAVVDSSNSAYNKSSAKVEVDDLSK